MQSKDRTYQVVAIVGLIIGVMALTIGFAAFTTTLTIDSAADYTPASTNLDVVFSTSASSAVTGTVAGVASGETGATAESATLTGTTVTGIMAHFTKPGQTVTYTFNVYNNSQYEAFLNEINFANASGESSFKVCSPNATGGNAAQATAVAAACGDITLTLNVDGYQATATQTASTIAAYSGTGNTSIDTTTRGRTVTVTIEYTTGHPAPDGDFTVAFGQISLRYSSVAPSA